MAGPARPPTERDVLHFLNGVQNFLGVIQSTGSATNNATTSVAFSAGTSATVPPTSFGPYSMVGTLAGKVLMIQPVGAGFFLPVSYSTMTPSQATPVVATQVLPVAANTWPGVSISSGESRVIIMSPATGWLQWIPVTSGNLFVWELT